MRGITGFFATIITIIITITALSLVIFYFYSITGKSQIELEKMSEEDGSHRANIEIINFNGSNITIRNNGGIILNISTFRIYNGSKVINFNYLGDELLKPNEEIILYLTESITTGIIRVAGEYGVVDKIDIDNLNK